MTRRTIWGLTWVLTLAGCSGDVSTSKPRPMDAGVWRDAGEATPDAAPLAPDPDAAVADAGSDAGEPYGVCSTDGWCFERPTPTSQTLYAGTRLAEADALFVGEAGLVLRFDGTGFRNLASSVAQDLHAVWAESASNVWIVGKQGTLLHFDGTAFESIDLTLLNTAGATLEDLFAVWGASASDVWVAGSAGALYHYDGSAWKKQTAVTGEPLFALWGLSSTQIYAVGDHGILLSYDGMKWIPKALPGGGSLRGIEGTSQDDLWAVGDQGRVRRFDGKSWTSIEFPLATVNLHSVRMKAPGALTVVGSNGATYDYDGSWHTRSSGLTTTLRAIVSDGVDTIFTVGDRGSIVRWEGPTRITYSEGGDRNHLAIFGRSDGETWIIGDELLHKQSEDFALEDMGIDRSFYAGFAFDGELGWAVGSAGTVMRWDGQTWSAMDSKSARLLRGVWASSRSSAWIVGEKGTILGLFNETSWVSTPSAATDDLYAVWGAAGNDCWAAGDKGTLVHWDGSEFNKVDSGTTVGLRAVWGKSKDAVWVAGTLGTILHWNGQAWSTQLAGAGYSLNAVWGREVDDVYAAGSGGTLLHFDGLTWTEEATPTDTTLFGLYGNESELRAVGAQGVVLIKR